MKLIINKNLNGRPTQGSLLNKVGWDGFNSNKYENNRKFFQKSLKGFMVGKNIDVKLDAIFQLFNTSKNIEIIQKSSTGKRFVNFIDASKAINQKDRLKNIALIARFDSSILENDKPANAIILTVDFVREGTQNDNIKFYAELVGTDILDLQKDNYYHSNILHLSKIDILDYDSAQELLLIQKQGDISELSRLERSLDIWGNSRLDALRLRDFKATVEILHLFLESKKNLTHTPFYVPDENNTESKINLDAGNEFKLYIPMDKEYKFNISNKKDIFYLGNGDNENLKIIVKSSKPLDSTDLYLQEKKSMDFQISGLENEHKALNEEISSLETDKQKILDRINVEKEDLKNIASLGENEKNNISEVNKELEDLLKKSKNIKEDKDNKIIVLKNHEKNIKTLTKKQKSNKSKDKSSQQSIDSKKIKQEIYLINKEILDLDKVLNQNKQEINGIKSHKQKMQNKLQDLEVKIENIEEEIQNLSLKKIDFEKSWLKCKKLVLKNEEKNKDLVNAKNNLQKCQEEFMKKNLAIFELIVLVEKNRYGRGAVEQMTMPATSWKNILVDFIQESFNDYNFTFSDYDAGMSQIIKRYLYTLRAYERGEFKSPYAALSLDNPDVKIKIDKDIHINGIRLNDGQQKAINSSANAHFASFLQGPPGTGKTQVISASILHAINKGENVVISSSTNAAIDNAMERINKAKNNPNVFLLRHSKNINNLIRHPEFSSNALYKSFLERIDGYILKDSSIKVSDEEKKLETFFNDKTFVLKYYPDIDFKKFLSNESETFVKNLFKKVLSQDDYPGQDYAIDDLVDKFKRYRRDLGIKYPKAQKIADDFTEKNNGNIKIDINWSIEDFYLKINNQNQKIGKFENLILDLDKNLESQNPGYNIEKFTNDFSNKSKAFAQKLIENDAINVIGITTTSRLNISLQDSNIKRELFTDYRVDFAIIDEVSKSTTPEILSISKLANRFMYAGDYRQLPPQFDLDQKTTEEFYNFVTESKDNKSTNILKEQASKGINAFKQWINNLFKNSLFYNLVEKMKGGYSDSQIAYQALKEQYRFNSVINEIVNYTYDKKEHLNAHFNDNHFKKYWIGNKKPSKSFVNLVDTSILSNDFVDIIKKNHDININADEDSFDQNKSLIVNREYRTAICDYNAYVIINLLKNLFQKNENLEPSIIGIIAMTRSQSQLIQLLLSKDEELKRYSRMIKIDTVDNFQGQERKIIILDLVRAKRKFVDKRVAYLKSRDISFYKSPERINVAVSRAKEKLIVVGAVKGYLANEITSEVHIDNIVTNIKIFEKWLRTIEEKGEILPWNTF